MTTPPSPLKYFIQISPVREVTLLGTADLAFWQAQLRPHGLQPANVDGYAQILISAVSSRFLWIPFREVPFAVFVSNSADGSTKDGVFLAHAFNSLWLFAFIERTLNASPYQKADIQVDTRRPAFQVTEKGGGLLLRAGMSRAGEGREPSRHGEETWEGPIFLPLKRPGSGKEEGKLFYARLSGEGQVYPFDPSRDRFEVTPSPRAPVLQWLVDSHFAGKEWLVREAGTHAKSKTVRKGAVITG